MLNWRRYGTKGSKEVPCHLVVSHSWRQQVKDCAPLLCARSDDAPLAGHSVNSHLLNKDIELRHRTLGGACRQLTHLGWDLESLSQNVMDIFNVSRVRDYKMKHFQSSGSGASC